MIDASSEAALFASVEQAALAKWQLAEHRTETDRWLAGVFGDVDMELRAFMSGTRPTVRATCGLSRFTPKSRELILELNALNRRTPTTTFGIHDEEEQPGTVRVMASASVLYDFITPVSVRQTVEACVWPANLVLRDGFLTKYGGELSLLVLLRLFTKASDVVGHEVAVKLHAQLAALEGRVRIGDVGRVPETFSS